MSEGCPPRAFDLKCRLATVSIARGYSAGISSARECALPAEAERARLAIAGPAYWAVQPPSMGIAAPVIERAARVQRNTASAPISSVVTNCRVGCA
jgi:hypothetical protein